jgi:aspartate racemase
MRTIGLLGGMTWESTLEYYRRFNRLVAKELGGLHSARCLIYSFDFQDLARLQEAGRWEELAGLLAGGARRLEQGGAELLLIGANTMHKLADRVQAAVRIPLVHIVDETARTLRERGVGIAGLLGTKITMEDGFFGERLGRHGITALVPGAADRAELQRIIFEELARGEFREESRASCLRIAAELAGRGAQGIVLGCTELPLLLPAAGEAFYDTLEIHVQAAVKRALDG